MLYVTKMAMGNLLKILLRAKLIPMRDYHILDVLFSFLSSKIRISECRPGGPSDGFWKW